LGPPFSLGEGEVKFYTVSEDYISYLRTVDARVAHNYGASRPYVGIVLTVNEEHRFLAPLTSYKPKHDKISTSAPTVFKLHDKHEPANKLGMLQLNNMVPILDPVISVLDFHAQERKYRSLLTKQLEFIKSNQDAIATKAQNLYRLVTEVKNDHLCRLSCDFLKLEACYRSFGQTSL